MIPTRIRAVPIVLLLFALAACAGTDGGRTSTAGPTASASKPTSSAPEPTGSASAPISPPPGPAGSAAGPTGAAPGTTDTRVVVIRSGGLAGIRDTITVEPQGQWTRVDSDGNRRTGRLTDDDRARLRALAVAPGLRAEAGRTATTTRCRDAFTYALTVGTTHVNYADCPGDPNRPQTAASIVALLLKATG